MVNAQQSVQKMERYHARKKLYQCVQSKQMAMNDLKVICMLREFGYDFEGEVV